MMGEPLYAIELLDRITFVMDFANSDLANAPDWELQKLKSQFSEFFGAGSVSVNKVDRLTPTGSWQIGKKRKPTVFPKRFETYDRRNFLTLQADTRNILKAVSPSSHPKIEQHYGIKAEINDPAVFKLTATYAISSGGFLDQKRKKLRDQRKVMILFDGNDRDLYLITLMLLLNFHSSDNRIRNCTECGKYFYRIKRQKFCSRQCTLNFTNRTWYERNKNNEVRKHELKKKRAGV